MFDLPEQADPYLKTSNIQVPKFREVRLTQGKVALVDEADFEWIMRWKWYAKRTGHRWYAARNCSLEQKTILMHRVLVFAQPGEEVDHVNGDGLNNRQANLRRCSHQENMCGFRQLKIGKSSRFRGVAWHSQHKKWGASIQLRSGVHKHLGYFVNEEDASQAYAAAARLHFGAFAANLFSPENKNLTNH